MEAKNHYETQYDGNRITLLRLMITLLSQPLFHAPDEYLVVLNPFSTYLTNRRCKNVKNLFVSLVNYIISYDCAGYVSIIWEGGWFRLTLCLVNSTCLTLISPFFCHTGNPVHQCD